MFTIWTKGINPPQQVAFCGNDDIALCSVELSEGRAVKCGNGYALFNSLCANGGAYNVT